MKLKLMQSPNVSKGRTIKPEGIIIHHTAGSYNGSVNWCMRAESQVSYHAIVDLDGSKTILAQDHQRAWHAGKSSFNGRNDCNSFMLGIAVSGDTNKRELTIQEAESVAYWCVEKMKVHVFGLNQITTHTIVSQGRKNDVDERAYERIMYFIKEILNVNC